MVVEKVLSWFFFQICKILLNADALLSKINQLILKFFFPPNKAIKIILRKFQIFLFYITIYISEKRNIAISFFNISQPYMKWNSEINMRRCKKVDDCHHLCVPFSPPHQLVLEKVMNTAGRHRTHYISCIQQQQQRENSSPLTDH